MLHSEAETILTCCTSALESSNWPRAGDATGHTLIFELTPEQFAKVKNGDEVRVSYGSNEESPDGRATPRRIWKFSKLDKSKIDK